MAQHIKKSVQKLTPSGLTLEAEYEGISYTIRKRKQAKRIIIRVSHDGRVWVSMPIRAAVRDAETFFAKNIDFVRQALAKSGVVDPPALRESTQQGKNIPLFGVINTEISSSTQQTPELPIAGEWYRVVVSVREHFGMELFPTHILLSVPQQYAESEVVMRQAGLRYWQYTMVKHANAILPKRTLELARELGEQVYRVAIKDQRSLWGSCVKSRKNINLNWRSILFPDEVRDYLIVHELAHLRHSNHSAAYWNHVTECCEKLHLQDYKLSERWIKQNGRRIMGLRNLVPTK